MVCEFYLWLSNLVARASVVVYVQFHDEATTNVVFISLRWQWQKSRKETVTRKVILDVASV